MRRALLTAAVFATLAGCEASAPPIAAPVAGTAAAVASAAPSQEVPPAPKLSAYEQAMRACWSCADAGAECDAEARARAEALSGELTERERQDVQMCLSLQGLGRAMKGLEDLGRALGGTP
jgi:hypothetical protein